MNYSQIRTMLIHEFIKHDFAQCLKNKESKTLWVDETLSGEKIGVVFPGYKTKPKTNGDWFYDYRVVLTKHGSKITLSHVNIIIDIYFKLTLLGINKNKFFEYLVKLIQDEPFSFAEAIKALAFTNGELSDKSLNNIAEYHKKLKKKYNRTGNRFGLTIDELFKAIKWIVIQEDINYPMEEGFLGRKMAFARYLEVFHCITCNTHTIKEVIFRALSHKKPAQWKDMDYSVISTI